MAFSGSSRNIRLEGTILKAECAKLDGSYQESQLDLDDVLGNIDGRFRWGYQAFSQSAFNIQLNNATLDAVLEAESSGPTPASINLDDGIANFDGVLTATN